MRDRAFYPVELFERHAGVLDVVAGGRVLSHLLHEALGRRDRVADLVRDRCREVLERALVTGLGRAPLLADALRDAATHLVLDQALAQARSDHRGEVVDRDTDPPGAGHDEGGAKAPRAHQDQGEHGRVGDEVGQESNLRVGSATRQLVGALLGRAAAG